MPTFQKCPKSVEDLAREIMCEFEDHTPLLDAKVKIDFLFALAEIDEKTGEPKGDALRHHGVKALGLCRKLSLKDRVAGRGDAEITLDGDWWGTQATPEQQKALLDHEIYHLTVSRSRQGDVKTDDIGRPKLLLRKHDFQVGFFSVIAARHGEASQERIQAKWAMEEFGQYFWPDMVAK